MERGGRGRETRTEWREIGRERSESKRWKRMIHGERD